VNPPVVRKGSWAGYYFLPVFVMSGWKRLISSAQMTIAPLAEAEDVHDRRLDVGCGLHRPSLIGGGVSFALMRYLNSNITP